MWETTSIELIVKLYINLLNAKLKHQKARPHSLIKKKKLT